MSQQLSLPIEPSDADLSMPTRLDFPVAMDGGRPFDDEGRFFEPWWPGVHAMLWRLGDRIELRTEGIDDPLVAFPELGRLALGLHADGLVVEGTLLALDGEGRPDVALLRAHLAGEAEAGPAEGAFVASDLPYLEGHSIAREPFAVRRQRLAAILPDTPHRVLSRGLMGEGVTMGHAVAAMGLRAISARRLDARWRSGRASDVWMRIPVTETSTAPTPPFLVLLNKLPFDE